ncbi:MAG TPA: universal stress protein, partial [Polyangiales bacterium]
MPRPQSILVCTDLSEASEFALQEALRWSAALRATLHVIHVVEPPVAADAVDITVSAHGQLTHRALLAIDAAISRAKVPDAVLGERWIRLGDPRDTILHAATQL